MDYRLAVIKGDGIGPDIVEEGLKVLEIISQKFGHTFTCKEVLAGGAAIDATGKSLPEETVEVCKASDSVILGAMGGPQWDNLANGDRPEKALLGLRAALGLFGNIRPAVLYPQLKDACPLKDRIIGEGGIDIVVVRELTGGIYFGERGEGVGELGAYKYDTLKYSEVEVERIARRAFEIAMKRGKKVTSVDKANVLDSSKLWRRVVEEVAREFPEVELNHLYVDNAAMQLVINPKQFDVIVTGNMFGDILSDEASMITGSIGMLPSASLGTGKLGMYEPIHGSAPDIAGQDKANPIATILSIAMMLRYSFDLENEAKAIEDAIEKVLEAGYRTGDIYSEGTTLVGTKEMGRLIRGQL
ncbi:3-isopropylmalate dehydrogenase [Anaerotalea alkaliphila]|uniref:3-isopropylmalate dehydrogenase n=1 Tax=Anaerotalea alkaliphila TaxID=2662126 RepID=A0A7X5KN34_9FIRM|nr:3-isopropylmalate dehydrogenase [Anaerotalea alkaliphila]NDL67619.1 3-isopropylmalate dehydrogenase [Anaerotalea alkaliphila]